MNIYVGNLPPDVTNEELRQEFIVFGEVVAITIMNDRYIGSGQPRAYAFVEMTSKSQGEAAIAGLNGKRLKDQVIEVIGALPLSEGTGNIHFSRRNQRFTCRVRRRKS